MQYHGGQGLRTGVDGPINITLDSSDEDADDMSDVDAPLIPEPPLAVAYAPGESPPVAYAAGASPPNYQESSVLQIPHEPTGEIMDESMIRYKTTGVHDVVPAHAVPHVPHRASFQPPAVVEPGQVVQRNSNASHPGSSSPPVSPRRASDHKPGLRNNRNDIPEGIVHPPAPAPPLVPAPVPALEPAPAPAPSEVTGPTDPTGHTSNIEEPPSEEPRPTTPEYPTPSKRKLEGDPRANNNKTFIMMGVILLVVTVIVVVVLVLVLGKDDGPSPTLPPRTVAPITTTPVEPTPAPVEPTPAPVVTEVPTAAVTTAAPTASPTQALEMVQDMILPLNVTKASAWEDPNSPQSKALEWVVQDVQGMEETQVIQRYALATLFYATTAETRRLQEAEWLSSENECTWFAVTCDEEGMVEALDFVNSVVHVNELQGVLPPELSLLTGLKRIIAPNYQLEGNLEDALFDLSNLQVVMLQGNQLNGTFPLALLEKNPNLDVLNLGGNNLHGTLPEFPPGTKLSVLQLEYGQFTGTIPESVGELSMLAHLDLEGNDLEGTIPESLYDLSELSELSFGNNTMLGGTLDTKIGQLSNLSVIEAQNTNLEGSIPGELYQLTLLRDIIFSNSSMSGPLSEDIRLLNATLLDLNLDNNRFSGPLPEALDVLTALESLLLDENEFTGTISDRVCDERGIGFQKLFELVADCNIVSNCNDQDCPTPAPTDAPTMAPVTTNTPTPAPQTAPPTTAAPTTPEPTIGATSTPTTPRPTPAALTGFAASLPEYTQKALLDETSPQSVALAWLLSHPRFAFIDDWRRRQLFALATFYHSYDGPDWSDAEQGDKKWLDYNEDECSWGDQGDDANQCIDGRITKLSLEAQTSAGNAITGTTPPEIAMLTSLKALVLFSINLETNLEGVLPSQLSNLTDLRSVRLTSLKLDGTLPSYLGEFQQLTSLSLRTNSMVGQIPSEIALMTSLRFLTMYNNDLGGTIPSEMATMSSLESLVIYGNYISGTFPTEVCALDSLSNIQLDCKDITCPQECNCICKDPDDEPPRPETPAPTSPTNETSDIPLLCDLGPTIPEESGLVLTLYDFTEAALQAPQSPQKLAYDWLASHAMLDTFPEWRKQQLFAMASFFYSYNGLSWGRREGEDWLNELVDECDWGDSPSSDIICDKDGRLLELAVEFEENFVGLTMPPEIGLLASVESLLLHENGLIADLESLLPTQLSCLPLKKLHLHNNELFGSIPSQLFEMTSVSNLFLYGNQLTGTLPTEFGLLTKMRFLTLFENLFTGPLPSQIGLLTELESIQIQETGVTGTVPDEICDLPSLRNFQVDCNMVTCPSACGCSCS